MRTVSTESETSENEQHGQRIHWNRIAVLAIPLAIMVFALAIRVYQYDRLSLWLDEIYVVEYLKLSWRELLGLEGAYDNHPPLYYAIVKLVSDVTGPVLAARYVSIVTGTLTVGAVYVLTNLLVNRRAATAAGIILAVSPVHIWYSQEGRMYAPAALAVALSYIALVKFLETKSNRWGALYSLTLIAAAYIDYSAFYGLAPQIAVVGLSAWQNGTAVLKRWLPFVGIAGIAYLPWIRYIFESIDFVGGDREFLIVDRQNIVDTFFSIVGLPGGENYYWGFVETPWAQWSEIRPASAALVGAVLIFSIITLTGQFRKALVVGASLLVGTIATAALLSYLVSPGFADRTVIYASIGWALLAGSAAFGRVPNGGKLLSLTALAVLIVFSAASVLAMQDQASKERYRDLAAATHDAATFGFPVYSVQRPPEPVLADSTGLIATAITSYEPGLTTTTIPANPRDAAFWHAYADYEWEQEALLSVQARFAELGYERVLSYEFAPILYLDFYAKAGADADSPIPLPTWDTIESNADAQWSLDPDSTSIDRRSWKSSSVVIDDSNPAFESVILDTVAESETLYMMSITLRFDLTVGFARIRLSCLDNAGELLQTNEMDLASRGSVTPIWFGERLAILCPDETTSVEFGVSNDGVGSLVLREPKLVQVRQGSTPEQLPPETDQRFVADAGLREVD